MDTTLTLTNQTNLFLTGVDKVISVSTNEIIVEIAEKQLCIKGEGFEVQTLDLENKVFIVNGLVECIKYQTKKQNWLKRIFK